MFGEEFAKESGISTATLHSRYQQTVRVSAAIPLAIKEHDDNSRLAQHQAGRCYFTPHQRTVLESIFCENNYPGDDERAKIARNLGVSEKRVKVWFTNRRTKLFRSGVAEPSAKLRFTALQKKILCEKFADNKYPSKEAIEQLMTEIDTSSKRIKIWFNNQRVKKKCTRGKRHAPNVVQASVDSEHITRVADESQLSFQNSYDDTTPGKYHILSASDPPQLDCHDTNCRAPSPMLNNPEEPLDYSLPKERPLVFPSRPVISPQRRNVYECRPPHVITDLSHYQSGYDQPNWLLKPLRIYAQFPQYYYRQTQYVDISPYAHTSRVFAGPQHGEIAYSYAQRQ